MHSEPGSSTLDTSLIPSDDIVESRSITENRGLSQQKFNLKSSLNKVRSPRSSPIYYNGKLANSAPKKLNSKRALPMIVESTRSLRKRFRLDMGRTNTEKEVWRTFGKFNRDHGETNLNRDFRVDDEDTSSSSEGSEINLSDPTKKRRTLRSKMSTVSNEDIGILYEDMNLLNDEMNAQDLWGEVLSQELSPKLLSTDSLGSFTDGSVSEESTHGSLNKVHSRNGVLSKDLSKGDLNVLKQSVVTCEARLSNGQTRRSVPVVVHKMKRVKGELTFKHMLQTRNKFEMN